MHEVEKVRSVIMRGGTSKGVYIMKNELPKDPTTRDKVISSIFGGADERQIDGLGGANSLTSKVAIVSVSERDDADIDYTFGQVDISTGTVDYNSNCGNILSGIGPFAIDEGLVNVTEPISIVRIYNTNTQKIVHAEVPVAYGKASTEGDYSIAGVPGAGAKIELNFIDAAGSKTGELFPTGKRKEYINVGDLKNIEVSILDISAPVIFVKAESIGLKGTELSYELSDNHLLVLEKIRGLAAEKLGFVNNYEEAVRRTPSSPKVVIVSKSTDYYSENKNLIKGEDIDFIGRAMSMQKMHKAFPVTGGICTASASQIKDTVVYECCRNHDIGIEKKVIIGHPTGSMDFTINIEESNANIKFNKTAVARTSRRLMEGQVYVSKHLFWGELSETE